MYNIINVKWLKLGKKMT